MMQEVMDLNMPNLVSIQYCIRVVVANMTCQKYTFTSNGMPINIRLIVPDTIYVDYCEYALMKTVFK